MAEKKKKNKAEWKQNRTAKIKRNLSKNKRRKEKLITERTN